MPILILECDNLLLVVKYGFFAWQDEQQVGVISGRGRRDILVFGQKSGNKPRVGVIRRIGLAGMCDFSRAGAFIIYIYIY